MSQSVLIIDDDPSVRGFLKEALAANDYVVAEAADGATGTSMVVNWKPDVVLLDIQMPGMDGISALKKIKDIDSMISVIMITSVDEIDAVRDSLRSGAYDYLIKPLDLPLVLETMDRAMEARLLHLEVESYQQSLEGLVYSRTEELEHALERIESTYNETILALGSALETRDVETQEHSLRVARYTIRLARIMGVDDEEHLRAIKRGAFLHDIGKIGVPDQILRKPGPLTPDEWVLMKEHPTLGVRLLNGIDFLHDALPIVRSHHERWDGGGYPDGRAGEAIPLEARAFAIADALDAITSDRPYRAGRSITDARRIISGSAGTQFDPAAVAALRAMSDAEIELIREETSHPYRLQLGGNQLDKVVEK